MVKCWIVLVLVITPIAHAWKSSAEEHRDPTDYRREPVSDLKDPTDYHRELAKERRLVTKERRIPINERKDLIQDRKDPIEFRKDGAQEPRETTVDRKEQREYRREQRRDSTGYRREPRELRRTHLQAKRHMLPDPELKKRITTQKPIRDIRKKPSGHLTPLEDDDMENDEVVSVAIGPPPLRGKYEKPRKKHVPKPILPPSPSAVTLVKDLFTQITKEFLSRDVDENFVFGQYIGNAMKNLSSELRLSMQHEVLELIVKYQKANRGELKTEAETKSPQVVQMLKEMKDIKIEKKFNNTNDTEESWPDFTNLAKIVG